MLDIETHMTGGAPAVADPRVAYYAAGYVRAQDLLDQNLFIIYKGWAAPCSLQMCSAGCRHGQAIYTYSKTGVDARAALLLTGLLRLTLPPPLLLPRRRYNHCYTQPN